MKIDTEAELKAKAKLIIKSKKYGDVIVLIDKEDELRISLYTWSVSYTNGRLYIKGFLDDSMRKVYLHRLIMDCPAHLVVDHINHNVLDNRKSNLRICSKSKNSFNSLKHKDAKTSKYKGVVFDKSIRKYIARICCEGRRYHIGIYEKEEDAVKNYRIKAKELHGEYYCEG